MKPDEPLSLTVHSMPAPGPQDVRRRTLSGRLKMLLVLLACAAPVLASYFTYYVIRPEGRNNYGTLVQPTRTIPPGLALRTLEGQAVDPKSLRNQWLLVVVGGGGCDAACVQRLYTQKQLRQMLGKERERLDKVWLITDDAPLPGGDANALNARDPKTGKKVSDEKAQAAAQQPNQPHLLSTSCPPSPCFQGCHQCQPTEQHQTPH
jgi:hypothetical protein